MRNGKWRQIIRLCLAATLFATLSLVGYRRGYEAEDPARGKQTMTTVSHNIGDLVGPDFSASGMMATADSLIDLIHSLHLEGERRAYRLNPIQAAGAYSQLQVTTYPHLHKDVERLLNQIRKPDDR